MTFKDYIAQKEPRRIPKGSVKVRRSDVQLYRESYGTGVMLKINGHLHCYVLPDDAPSYNKNILYTMDGDGNPRERSVFKLV